MIIGTLLYLLQWALVISESIVSKRDVSEKSYVFPDQLFQHISTQSQIYEQYYTIINENFDYELRFYVSFNEQNCDIPLNSLPAVDPTSRLDQQQFILVLRNADPIKIDRKQYFVRKAKLSPNTAIFLIHQFQNLIFSLQRS